MKLLKSLLIAIGIVTLGFTIVIGEVLIGKVFGTVAFLLVMALLLVIAYTTLFYLAEKDNWTQKKPKLTKLERNTIYDNLLYYFRSVILYHIYWARNSLNSTGGEIKCFISHQHQRHGLSGQLFG